MKVKLTVSSLGSLEKTLKNLSKELREAPEEIVETLLDFGELEAGSHILTGYSSDGNVDVHLMKEQEKNKGTLSITGSDVAYQEFGYGLIGSNNPNPKQPAGYSHGSRKLWVYIDETGKKRWSTGMTAQMPMYKASRAIREVTPRVVSDIIKRSVGETK